MEKLRCDCGFEVEADDERELVAAVQSHAWLAHAMTLTREEALVLVLRSELDRRHASGSPSASTDKGRKQ